MVTLFLVALVVSGCGRKNNTTEQKETTLGNVESEQINNEVATGYDSGTVQQMQAMADNLLFVYNDVLRYKDIDSNGLDTYLQSKRQFKYT